MFSIFKKKGIKLKDQRSNDFKVAYGAIKKGEKLSDRDKQLIALGRTQVHRNNHSLYKYKQSKQAQAVTRAEPKTSKPKKVKSEG